MMNASESTAMPTSGKSSPSSSTTCPSLLLLRIKFSACTVVCPQVLTPSIKLDSLIEFRRCPRKVPCATCSGLTPMIDVAGVSRPEVQATVSARIFLSSSTTQITSPESPVPISWSCKGTTGPMTAMWSLYLVRLTTATAAVTRLLLWPSTSSWNSTCKSHYLTVLTIGV